MIEAVGLRKAFTTAHANVQAVADISFAVPAGSVLGVLGPNGSGKTTTVRMLATLLRPDAGSITIGGIDALAQPHRVRTMIGLAGQYAAVDERLTVRENLELIARLARVPRPAVRERAMAIMGRFRLADYRDRPSAALSGGLRRRLDLAACLVADPQVVFLDEPTTGLDPGSRIDLWDAVRTIVADGATILLTTQYLEEADQLADRIVVIDHGRVIAEGTPDALKSRIGGDVIEFQLDIEDRHRTALAGELAGRVIGAGAKTEESSGRVSVPVPSNAPDGGQSELNQVLARLRAEGLTVTEFGVRRPSLDDVFLALTGHPQGRGDP